jgi:hypothetical protein
VAVSTMVVIQASQDKKSLDVGANLFVGNLDPVCMSVALLLNSMMDGLVLVAFDLNLYSKVKSGCTYECR